MSMTLPRPVSVPTRQNEQIELPIEVQHVTYLGSSRFTCIQPDCDREHHVWCSCAA